jgi:DhnA family fructose-bisphosphate aldolase class Ia
MKLTKRQLKQIIKEEITNLSEDDVGSPIYSGQSEESPDVETLEVIFNLCQDIGKMLMGMRNEHTRTQIEEHMVAIMKVAQDNM